MTTMETSTTSITPCNLYAELFSCASLRIEEDDWNSLVNSDIKLALQVGLLLLRNNKELETVLEATEKQYEKEKTRANQYENQLLNDQSKMFSNLEQQIQTLTTNYKGLLDDCQMYKAKNNTLWLIVESLERECEEYLQEINSLRNEINSRKESEIRLRRLSAPPQCFQKEILIEDREHIEIENEELKQRIKELQQVTKNLKRKDSLQCNIEFFRPLSYLGSLSNSTTEETIEETNSPTVRHYREIFAEIFAKLKTTREEMTQL